MTGIATSSSSGSEAPRVEISPLVPQVARRSPGSERCRRGFTLIEVMIAVAVIAFAFVGLVGLHGRNIQLIDRANHYSRATLLARELLTQLQFEGGATLSSGSGVFESYPEYHWQTDVADTTFDTVKRVTVHITWDQSYQVELVYYVGQPDE